MTGIAPSGLAALLFVLAMALGVAPTASSAALSPGELRIEDEESWHADPSFAFRWRPLPPPGPPTESAYRLYDSKGKLVRDATRHLRDQFKPIEVPRIPAAYTLETWLQDEAGNHGPHSTARARFDNTPPPPPALRPPSGWVMGAEPATLGVDAGTSALPLSGVRGYAVSVDRGDGSAPCASPTRCGADEIDLRDTGTVSLGTLPEGTNVVRMVAVSGSGVASPVATAEVRVDGSPPAVQLRGVPAGWSDGPVRVAAMATDQLSGMAAAGPSGPFTAIGVDGAAASSALGAAVTTTIAGNGVHAIESFARDAAGNVADADALAAATAVIRIDEGPPSVAFSPAQDPADPERVEASVSDRLSGPSSTRGWIGVRAAGTRSRFQQLPTRVTEGRLVARWDSESYAPGKYEFLATGFDLAGNAGTGANRARGSKMVLVSPLKVPSFLEAGFVGRRSWTARSRSARYGRGVKFGGRLRTTAGGAPSGLEVVVTEIFAEGAGPPRRTTIARTDLDGGFSVRLAPGPSREVVAEFGGSRTLTRASSEGARLEVPGSVRLRASADVARIGGAAVVFSGRVAAAGTTASAVANLPVELQFRFRGSGWREFRTVETDARGRFRYAYRFSDDDSRGVRFQFRAYVKGREGWPYGPGASRPVLVTGR